MRPPLIINLSLRNPTKHVRVRVCVFADPPPLSTSAGAVVTVFHVNVSIPPYSNS